MTNFRSFPYQDFELSLPQVRKTGGFAILSNRRFKNKTDVKIVIKYTHQLGPRYEGQLMSDGGAYSPFCSILLVLTHDFIIICVYGPTGSDGHEWMVPTRTLVAHHFWPFEAKGVLYARGPVQPANGPPTRTTSG